MTVCDSCGMARMPADTSSWAHGREGSLCDVCFKQQYGVPIELHMNQKDREFLEAIGKIKESLPTGEILWLGEPKYVGAFPPREDVQCKPNKDTGE